MTDIPEFIVESIDLYDDTWKFFNDVNKFNGKKVKTLNGGLVKKFTSLATNATIFRWKFGNNPIIETTVNPYIYTFQHGGAYDVSHQSCYPCLSTGTLVCSNGWCTKNINVIETEKHKSDSLVALAGLAGLFLISSEQNCCDTRKICLEKRATCKGIKPEDIGNTKMCKEIEKTCANKLEDCRKKCVATGNTWKPLPYRCIEKHKPYKEVCQIIDHQKKHKKDNNRNMK